MKVYIYRPKNFGAMVVIVANSSKEALELLKQKEGDEPYLSHNLTADNFKEVDLTTAAVVGYLSD